MVRNLSFRYWLVPLFMLLFVFSTIDFVQAELAPEGIEEYTDPGTRPEGDFGPNGWVVTYIPVSAFQQQGNGTYNVCCGGNVYRTGGTQWWWGPVMIPNGVDIWAVKVYSWDGVNNHQVCHYLRRYTGVSTIHTLGGACTGVASSPGWTSASFDPVHIMDNRYGYSVEVSQTSTNSVTTFRGARIAYARIMAPAGSQSFNDVPPSHPFFAAVNNLARAGVTQGCGGGNYCPNNAVNRGQMAAFMSRLAGLWQGFTTSNP